jgi:hypothetical protein
MAMVVSVASPAGGTARFELLAVPVADTTLRDHSGSSA